MSKKRDNSDQSVDILTLIDSICADFRSQWKSSRRPRLSDFLNKAPENAGPNLFRSLLAIDIRYRKQLGENPTSGSYLKSYPQFRQIISDAFQESLSIDFGANQQSPPIQPSEIDATIETTSINQIGDYELLGELGRGAFGIVYEAQHSTRGNRVALKTLPSASTDEQISPDRLHRFRREFRSLSEINHPNLIGMQTLEVDDGKWFFTMDLVEGTDFLSFVRPHERLDEQRLRSTLSQLVKGIIELHDRGIIHRDLKPSNVLVDDNGRVVILDFGLVAQMQRGNDATMSRSAMFAGTPRYAAPEQMFGDRSEASDWYAIGTMVFEALTGDIPFQGQSMEVLRQKQEQESPSLIAQKELPDDLARLVDGLLRRDPPSRTTKGGILDILQIDLETRVSGSTQGSHGSSEAEGEWENELNPISIEEIELVGRDDQLAELEAAKRLMLKQREPVVVWIAGKSGEGKSSLAEKFFRPLRKSGEFVVLQGRCYDRESVPFKAIECVIDPLCSYLRTKSSSWLENRLPADTPILTHLFPILRRVKSISEFAPRDFSNLDERQVRYRAFNALRELLSRISESTPLILFVDDLQWGDGDSAEVIRRLLVPPNPPAILLVGSYRSDEMENSSFLRHWASLRNESSDAIEEEEIHVAPLTPEQCGRVVANRVGIDPERIARQETQLYEETQGNPFLLEELIEGFDAQTGEFNAVPLEQVIDRKLSRLPSESKELLDVIAIAGHAISLDEASRIAGHTTPSFSAVTHMRSERLLRLIGSTDYQLVDTYHDKIRETILRNLDDVDSREWHLRSASFLESEERLESDDLISFYSEADISERIPMSSNRVHDLAYHFEEAGNRESAFAYTVMAAEQSAHAYANDEAIGLYEQAEQLLPKEGAGKTRLRLWLSMGRTIRRNKETKRALSKLDLALNVADTVLEKALIYIELGNVHDQLGHPDQAIEHFDIALKLLGERRPTGLTARLFSIGRNSFRTMLIPIRWQIAKTPAKRMNARIREEIWRRLWFCLVEKSFISTFDATGRYGIAAFQSNEPGSVARGHALLAIAWSANSNRWIGKWFLSRSNRVNSQLDDPSLQGWIFHAQGLCSYWLGDLSDAESSFEQSLIDLDRCGDYSDLLLSTHLMRHIKSYNGKSSDELAYANKVRKLAYEIGHTTSICWGEYDSAAALSRNGRLEPALTHLKSAHRALPGERYLNAEAVRAASTAYVMLQCSCYEQVKKYALVSWDLMIQSYLFVDTSLFSLPLGIEGIVGANWLDRLPTMDQRLLKKMLRRSHFFYQTIPNLQPHLQRVAGRAAMAMGKKRKAQGKFEKAIKLSKRKYMDYQQAKSLLDLASIKDQGREEIRAEAIRLLKKTESVIPRAEAWLLGDQYDEEVVAPELDLEAWEKENGPIAFVEPR